MKAMLSLLLLAWLSPGAALTLYPNGVSNGDSRLSSTDGAISARVDLPSSTFLGRQISSAYVYDDGAITLVNKSSSMFWLNYPNLPLPTICAFCADIDLSGSGSVTYRMSANPNMTSFSHVLPSDFTPTWALVVTWLNVASWDNPQVSNTFQAVLTSDQTRTYLLLLYDVINWYQDVAASGSVRAWAGYSGGPNGTLVALNNSRTANMISLATDSNTGTPGLFVFRLSPEQSTATTEPATTEAATTVTTQAATTTVATQPTTPVTTQAATTMVTTQPATTVTTQATTSTGEPATNMTSAATVSAPSISSPSPTTLSQPQESRVGLLLTAHFIVVIIAGVLVLIVAIVLIVVLKSYCTPKGKATKTQIFPFAEE